MIQILYGISAGVVAGIFAGFFGIGGGIILIPFLMLVFGFPQQTANGTSLVALLLPVGILGVMAYYRAGKIGPENIKLGLIIAVGMFIGTYFGSQFALALPVPALRKAFSIFLIAIAVKVWLS